MEQTHEERRNGGAAIEEADFSGGRKGTEARWVEHAYIGEGGGPSDLTKSGIFRVVLLHTRNPHSVIHGSHEEEHTQHKKEREALTASFRQTAPVSGMRVRVFRHIWNIVQWTQHNSR